MAAQHGLCSPEKGREVITSGQRGGRLVYGDMFGLAGLSLGKPPARRKGRGGLGQVWGMWSLVGGGLEGPLSKGWGLSQNSAVCLINA